MTLVAAFCVKVASLRSYQKPLTSNLGIGSYKNVLYKGLHFVSKLFINVKEEGIIDEVSAMRLTHACPFDDASSDEDCSSIDSGMSNGKW